VSYVLCQNLRLISRGGAEAREVKSVVLVLTAKYFIVLTSLRLSAFARKILLISLRSLRLCENKIKDETVLEPG